MAALIPRSKSGHRRRTEFGVTADWFVRLGLGLFVIGGFAVIYLMAATIVTTLYIGILIMIGSGLHFVHALRLRDRNHRLFWLGLALLYGASGALAYYNPLLNATALTQLMAAMLVAVGIFRIVIGMAARGTRGAYLMAAGGVLGIVIGAIIGTGWPADGPWIFGMFLSFDLVFQGIALVATGMSLTAAETRDAG